MSLFASGVDVYMVLPDGVPTGVAIVSFEECEAVIDVSCDGPGWESFKVVEKDVVLEFVDLGGLTPRGICVKSYYQLESETVLL